MTDDDWPVLDSRAEYETGWYTGGYDRVRQPDGSEKNYYWADLPPAVVLVAPLDGDLLMVEQYRPPVRERFLELPAGIVEDGESFEEAGARELEEEVGYAPAETELIETCWCSTGVLRHERGFVYATDLEPGQRKLDGDEFLDVVRVPVEEALARVRADPSNDATLEGVLLARADGYL
ncbi:MAG: NUDIX hydrolase [Haloarculaceae archaeon]